MVSAEYSENRNTRDVNGEIKAKVVLLGDPDTGKSSLVQNLVTSRTSRDPSAASLRSDAFFSVVEIYPNELDNSDSSVFLKVWEHSMGISVQEEELACRGALICIITLDICKPESANNAFNKWLLLKQNYMNECFLFVVGTGLDRTIHRRVQIKDVCRACAQKGATYLEVSNTDGSNITLLRRLICQRLIYMLKKRDVINAHNEHLLASASSVSMDINQRISPAPEGEEEEEEAAAGESESNEDDEDSPHREIRLANSTLSVPLMEQNIMSDSVGSILASYLGADSWPGFEAEEQRLVALGSHLSAFADELARDRSIDITASVGHINLSDHPLAVDEAHYQFDPVKGGGARRSRAAGTDPEQAADESDYVDSAYSMSELKTAFEIMGLSLPRSLSSAAAAVESHSLHDEIEDENGSGPRKISYLRKMIVRLPDGNTADMVLDLEASLEQQIELFLLSNSISEDAEARRRLVSVLHQIREEYYATSGHSVTSPKNGTAAAAATTQETADSPRNGPGSPHPPPPPPSDDLGGFSEEAKSEIRRKLSTVNVQPFARFVASKKCKLRLVLAAGSSIEVIVQNGDDLLDTAENIKNGYRLSAEMKQKVYEQLLDAFQL